MDAQLDGINIHYEIYGQGKPILLLHGWGTDSSLFQPIATPLSAHFRVITLDLPGFGGSSKPPTDWSLSDYSDCILKFINYLKLEKPVIAGHSFGGKIAIFFAATNTNRIEKLILISSSGITLPLTLKQMMFLVAAKIGKATFSLPILSTVKEKARSKLYEKLGENDYIQAGPLKKTFTKVVRFDIRKLLPKIRIPVLIMWGKNDTDTPLVCATILHKLLPNSQVYILENSTHFPFLEQPIECIQKIEEFLSV